VPEKLEEEDAVEDDGPVIHVPLPLNLMLWCMELYSLLLEPSMLFHVLHFVFACLGIWRPFFFCYHLLEIVYRSPTLQVGRRVCVWMCGCVCVCVCVVSHVPNTDCARRCCSISSPSSMPCCPVRLARGVPQAVLAAVTHNSKQLVMTAVMMVCAALHTCCRAPSERDLVW
jgi:hypothetical protein